MVQRPVLRADGASQIGAMVTVVPAAGVEERNTPARRASMWTQSQQQLLLPPPPPPASGYQSAKRRTALARSLPTRMGAMTAAGAARFVGGMGLENAGIANSTRRISVLAASQYRRRRCL